MTYDVAIVGAGPVGLFLATEICLAGASVVVLEREVGPDAPLKGAPFGLRGLSASTIEAFDRRGILADIAGDAVHANRGGHFAGIAWDEARVDLGGRPYRLADAEKRTVATTMAHLERILSARATAMGATIRRGVGVVDVQQANEAVAVTAVDGRSYHARWLVGCDGGRSVVRKAAAFAFPGTEPRFTGYSVHVDLADGVSLPLGRNDTPTGMYVQPQPGVFALADFDGGAGHRGVPLTPERVQAVLCHVTGSDVTVTAMHLATTWTDRARQATTYRHGRILLAGDAAHIHSPLGGQGLNLGFGDAMNLGWRLGAVVRGSAPEKLLDGYTRERHAVGAAVLDWSRAQVALLEPNAHARAIAGIVRDLIDTRDGATYFAERSSGLSVRYALEGRHPLVGRSAPDFRFVNGGRLGELLTGGTAVLLDFHGYDELRTIGALLGGELRYVTAEVEESLGVRAVLVRPDGVVAWACDDAPDADEVTEALATWMVVPGVTAAGRRP
ncbi:FAD-dependent monooxygenase [Mycolicibacterium sp. 120266]|uniref:FAD-dependent monooxygenase n=1 Tax=Mycolicibacterium sp. 120266 TaxID=3090601 RepID=UPI00299F1BB2|nr:FAD-dependent monooxygenase [Mycolicibacterium sp. 120266]MDX1876074.1 FAD-dependent monooxygenase [Mycolicibacterium sp. 120266]